MPKSKFIIAFIPLLLCGCVTESRYRHETLYKKFVPVSQIHQSNVSFKRKQKIVQNNNSQSVYVYNQNPSYSRYSENQVQYGEPKQYRQSYRTEASPHYHQTIRPAHTTYTANPSHYSNARHEVQQAQANLQREEARQFEQARQNSLVTARQEEEARQMEQARLASLQTYAEEQAKRG